VGISSSFDDGLVDWLGLLDQSWDDGFLVDDGLDLLDDLSLLSFDVEGWLLNDSGRVLVVDSAEISRSSEGDIWLVDLWENFRWKGSL